MKKIITSLLFAGALAFNANALITVSWSVQDSGGTLFWLYDSTGDYPGTGGAGNNWVCQLIDSGSSTLPNYNALFTDYQGGTFNQGTVLQSGAFNGNAATPGFSLSESADNSIATHYLYIRFFNLNSSQAGFIESSTWQAPTADNSLVMNSDAAGILGTVNTTGATPGADGIGLANTDISGGGTPGFTTVLPVPEPTSMALFGLGGLLIGLRRKFRKA